ncbi:ABC transporter permease [Streptacidiphilus sp. P02-A3a]|uniref:ABC transporter permease n=1 Tax=Streptacidiphilus sp. P02-A3a TaxID=2704468 RepID=UPI0015F98785|nr:ABC transporter permease [Streptacidiphilus sp. P02-A3a]QMU68801.1 ABC transporter permease [Streptacidiphilus sp. P02-A3a]
MSGSNQRPAAERPSAGRLTVGSREAVGLVATREIQVRIRSKAFLVTLFITALAAIALPLIPHLIDSKSGPVRIAVPVSDSSLSAALQGTATELGQKITISTVPDHGTGVSQVGSGKVDVLAEPGADGQVQATVNKSLGDSTRQLFQVVGQQQALGQQFTQLGATPAQAEHALAAASGAQVQVTTLKVKNTDPQQGQHISIAIAAGLLMYMSLMLVGQIVAQGVVEEKSSRVVELLLATIRPWQLLFGKVLGTGLLGLLQMAVPALLGVGVGIATGALNISLSDSVGAVAWALLWYVVGFAIYAMVFAALGATVSRQEDVQGLTFPAIAPLIAAWVIGISVVPSNPGSSLVTWLSLLPPFAPVLMPMRIAMGVAPVWQILLALVLALAFAFLLLRFAARIYRNSVLRSGSRVPLREALKAA